MFATDPALRLEIPSALMDADVWDSVEIVIPEPFLVVTTSQEMADGVHATRTFFAKAHHLANLCRHTEMRVLTVDLLSPARVNGSDGWRLDRLDEVWECRDANETHTSWLFRTASGEELCDSLVGDSPGTLVRGQCVFSTEVQRAGLRHISARCGNKADQASHGTRDHLELRVDDRKSVKVRDDVEDSLRQLQGVVDRIVAESGDGRNFDSERWLAEWIQQPNPALGGRRPYEMLQEVDGIEHVRSLLLRFQSGAYS